MPFILNNNINLQTRIALFTCEQWQLNDPGVVPTTLKQIAHRRPKWKSILETFWPYFVYIIGLKIIFLLMMFLDLCISQSYIGPIVLNEMVFVTNLWMKNLIWIYLSFIHNPKLVAFRHGVAWKRRKCIEHKIF